jgi:FAD-dependent oxidoreductase domain-containing protein 1
VVETADILIIGGGIMGCSVAMHLSSQAPAGTRIVVVERDPSYRDCATTRSAGGVRQQFSTPECIAMSQSTIAFVRGGGAIAAHHTQPLPTNGSGAAPAQTADFAFREHGYLLLASDSGLPTLTRNAAVQRKCGAGTEVLQPGDLSDRFPWLDPAGIAAGGFGTSGEGWLDPALLLGHLKTVARTYGVQFQSGDITGIERHGDRVSGATLKVGTRIACDHVVNCAGPQAGYVARLAGIDLPVEPRKRFIFSFDCRDAPHELAIAPLTVDPTGVWFRPEGRQFITGISPASDAEEPVSTDLGDIDYDLFQDKIWPVLAARVPAFAAIKLTGAWAGHYDFNIFDQNAVIGPHDEVSNFHLCNGFSGHGLQHAIAAGRAVAERILQGRFATLDLTRLGYSRIRRREPLIEMNVI